MLMYWNPRYTESRPAEKGNAHSVKTYAYVENIHMISVFSIFTFFFLPFFFFKKKDNHFHLSSATISITSDKQIGKDAN